ncbi:MAG: restriction endonuclease [Candidatus Saccharimonadales bacterium]
MAYYTDEDRRRAATRRKLNSQFRQIRKSPEDYYDIMGVAVPRVDRQPLLSDYGLEADVEQRLHEEKQYLKSKRKAERTPIGILWFSVFLMLCAWFAYETQDIANTIAIALIFGLPLLIGLSAWVGDDSKLEVSNMQFNYDKYKKQKHHYDYWQRKQSKEHWNSMSGHAFEQAVANLFRNIGFNAKVSNRGGDGGIDIILQKADRRIAVQCKRYKSSVGPHVIRDLWGTMHNLGFNEGCIVTTTGFTKGVTAFAQDKNIFLIDLNDILRAIGANGDTYLKRQVGEH